MKAIHYLNVDGRLGRHVCVLPLHRSTAIRKETNRFRSPTRERIAFVRENFQSCVVTFAVAACLLASPDQMDLRLM